MAWPGNPHRRQSTRDYTKLDGRVMARLGRGPANLAQLRDHVGPAPYHLKLRNRLATLVARRQVLRKGMEYRLP